MNLTFLIYLVGMVDNVIGVLISFSLLIVIYLGIVTVGGLTDGYDANELKEYFKKYSTKKMIIILLILMCLIIFIPNSKTISAMYLIPKIAENKEVKEIPEKALKLLNGKLDKWISNITKPVEVKE